MKIAGALALAALLARATRARAAADAGERLLATLGHQHGRAPRLRPNLSFRVWAGSFVATSLLFLVHADVDSAAAGRWAPFAPWLHTYALPVFAVLALGIAILWRCASWLDEVEEYAERAIARVRRILGAALHLRPQHARASGDTAPRRRFGLSFESRPPPLPA